MLGFSKKPAKPTPAQASAELKATVVAAIETARKGGLTAYQIASELESQSGVIRAVIEQREVARQFGPPVMDWSFNLPQ
jgi:hypothetical protein